MWQTDAPSYQCKRSYFDSWNRTRKIQLLTDEAQNSNVEQQILH